MVAGLRKAPEAGVGVIPLRFPRRQPDLGKLAIPSLLPFIYTDTQWRTLTAFCRERHIFPSGAIWDSELALPVGKTPNSHRLSVEVNLCDFSLNRNETLKNASHNELKDIYFSLRWETGDSLSYLPSRTQKRFAIKGLLEAYLRLLAYHRPGQSWLEMTAGNKFVNLWLETYFANKNFFVKDFSLEVLHI